MRIIGLDIGEKRIGVAKADSTTRIAVPVGYIEVDGSEWQEIARLANVQGTKFFVLGLPRSNEGAETQQSVYVRNFAKILMTKMPGAKVRFQDESLTSVVAEERLKATGKPYDKGDIDTEAATIILQDFLEKPNKVTPEGSFPEDIGATMGAIIASEPRDDGRERSVSDGKGSKELQDVKNLAKKQSDKVKLNTKKAKHKMKTATKWISGVAIIVILGLIVTGVALFIRDQRYKSYQEQFAALEAQMEADVYNFTILPGETIFQIREAMIKAGFPDTEVDEALNGSYDFDFLKNRPEGATLEGYLYGETHEFYSDTSAREVIETYLKGMGEVIRDNNLEAKYAERGLSLYEGITLASIVQKESSTAEMPTVAQVFLSRLEAGIMLGSDVTVSYAIDVADPHREIYGDNESALSIDSCYNTRKYAGLPCGPISNPGLEALLAVANPSDTGYFYFLTGDDGLMYYSYTEAEHLQNAALHCQTLCNVSL